METWPNPYLPGAISSTAQVSETTTATSTVTGQVTNTGTSTTVSSAFSTTNIFNDSATMSAQSPAGFSPSLQNAAGELQTGWAQLNEVDISSGTNAGGLVNASFKNIGSETTTYSFFSTTNTTPTSANPVIYQEMQYRSMSTSTAETGTYTTTAPGAPSVTPTLDNPAGYAKFNEERKDNNFVSNTASVSWVATVGSSTESESAGMSYTGSATSSYTSDKTIAVDAGANTDSQSGSYTATGVKVDWSTMGWKGDSVGPMYAASWTYGSTLGSGRSITDSGTYPSGGLETVASGGGRVWAETDVFSLNSPSIDWNWTCGYTSSTGAPAVSVTQSDSLAQSMADPGPDAPQEAKDGQPQGWGAWLWDVTKDVGQSIVDTLNPSKIGERMYAAYEVIHKDEGAAQQARIDAKGALYNKMIDPNSSMTVNQFRAANAKIISDHANEMIQDTLTVVDGAMAVGDAIMVGKIGIGLSKMGVSMAKGAVNSSFVQCTLLQKACFAPGTPLHAPKSAQLIETFLASGGIVTRDENNPKADARIGMVDDVFKLTARIWELHIGGRVIETTAEHPFYLVGPSHVGPLGWTPLCRLKPGDLLLGRGPVPTAVERVVETNRTATVYNLRVEPDHTFFVGGDDWGFSLWVHNTPCVTVAFDKATGQTTILIRNKFAADSAESRQLRRFVKAWNQEIAKAGGSMTRRKLTDAENAAAAAWRQQQRRLNPARFAGKIVGHVPDAAAGGLPFGGRAMALLPSVNSFLAGVTTRIKKDTVYNVVQLTRDLMT